MGNALIEKLFMLQGKTIVLTGAGGVLAGELAVIIAQCGANVVLLDISKEAVDKVAKEILEKNGEVLALQADVLNRESLENACGLIMEKYGKIDGLINGAGGNRVEATTSDTLSFFDIPIETEKKVMDLNFIGTLLPCKVFGREMVKQELGSIINIASIAGFRPLTRAASYAAGKAAVINFTKWLAVHICQNYSRSIRVNAIAPGFFATQQNKYLLFNDDGELTPRGETILSQVPQNRFGTPSELAGAVIWLLSSASSFCTGTVITVDAGFDAYAGV